MPITNKSIFSHFFSGTIFIGVARISTIVLGLVSVMLATRYLTTDAYGTYVLVMLFSNFLVQFMSFGLGLVIPKYLASNENEEYKTTLINTVFHFKIIIVLIVVLLIVGFQPFLAGLIKSDLSADIFSATPAVFLVISFTQLFEAILRGRFKFKAIGIIEIIAEIAELFLLIFLVVVYEFGFWGLLMAKIVTRLIWIALAYRAIQFEHKWEFNIPLLKEMLKFGFPLQLQYIFDFAYSKLDTLIVGSFLGTSGVALYDIARKIPDSLDQLYSVFISVYFPISASVYATEEKEKTDYILNNSIRLIAVLSLFATLITVFFGKDIIILLFSEEYIPIYWALVLLMIGLTLKMVESTLGYSLVAIGEPDKPLYINIMRAIVSLVGNLTLLPILGLTGAALVFILGNLVAIPVNIFFLRRKDISIKSLNFLKLVIVFGFLFSLVFLWGQTTFIARSFIVLLYIPFNFFLSVITIRDFTVVFEEVRSLGLSIKKKLQKE